MSQEAEYFLSANGRPFSDVDAARRKAGIVSEELGVPYQAVPHPLGGYAVSLAIPAQPDIANDPFIGHAPRNQGGRHLDNSGIDTPVRDTRTWEIIKLRPAWRGFWREYVVIFTGFVVLIQHNYLLVNFLPPDNTLPPDVMRLAVVFLLSVGLFLILVPLLKVLYTVFANQYLIYHDQVETRHGIIARNTTTIKINDIRSIDLRQGIIERLINVGTVELSTAGTATLDAESRISGIASPVRYQREINARRQGVAWNE